MTKTIILTKTIIMTMMTTSKTIIDKFDDDGPLFGAKNENSEETTKTRLTKRSNAADIRPPFTLNRLPLLPCSQPG